VCASGAVNPEWVQACREQVVPKGVRLSTTTLPGVLLVRVIGQGAEAVRQTLEQCWQRLRPQVMGCEPHAPRIWAT
jgi:urease accessory protein